MGEGHKQGIWTQISFSVQMPSPREVTLGQKSANSSLQEHYCWSKELNEWSKVPTTGRLVKSNPPPMPGLPPPPYPSGLTLIGALCVRNDRTKTSNRTPQLQIQIKGKEALRQIITSYLHTNLCIQPGYSPVNCVQLCFHCSRLFHGLLPHILTCLHEVCEIEPITLRRRHRLSAYPARL